MRVQLAILALVLVACSEPVNVDRDADAALQTDRLKYRARVNGSNVEAGPIHVTFTNRTDRTMFLGHCNHHFDATIERWTGTQWEDWSRLPPPDCLSPAFPIEPGATYAGRAYLGAGFPGSNFGNIVRKSDFPGVFRIRWRSRYYTVEHDRFGRPIYSNPVEEPHTVSNRFVLTLDD